MISKEQYNYIKWINQEVKKRENLDSGNPIRTEAHKKYLDSKKNPHRIYGNGEIETKTIIKNRKSIWKSTITKRDIPLTENEFINLVSKREKIAQWQNIDLKIFIDGLKLDQYLSKFDGKYCVNVEGNRVYEEYRLERISKIRLPIIAIFISVIALLIAIFTG